MSNSIHRLNKERQKPYERIWVEIVYYFGKKNYHKGLRKKCHLSCGVLRGRSVLAQSFLT